MQGGEVIATVKPRLRAARQSVVEIRPKRVDPHYLTPEHKAWRDAVIARADRTCEWPGCGKREGRMFADHIHERRDGGDPFDLANGQCLCGAHHSLKTARERARRLSADAAEASHADGQGGRGGQKFSE